MLEWNISCPPFGGGPPEVVAAGAEAAWSAGVFAIAWIAATATAAATVAFASAAATVALAATSVIAAVAASSPSLFLFIVPIVS